MNVLRLWVLGLLALGVGAAGCGEEETGGEAAGCSPDACEIGESACVGGAAVGCEADARGCGRVVVTACEAGERCEAGACVVGAACAEDACTPGAPTCADEATVALCVEGPDGCGVATSVSCGDGARCDGGVCVGSCVDLDGDGWGVGCLLGEDCDDADASANPVGIEVCDGSDDDCDGEIDEGFPGLGDGCSVGEGACASAGVFVCNGAGDGVRCDATPLEREGGELCGNGQDDDCDGGVDEGYTEVGQSCGVGLGVCAREGVYACNDTLTGLRCDGVAGSPSQEECNGQDDDCDGMTDEGFPRVGETCRQGVGRCERVGRFICAADGASVVCDAAATEPLDTDLCGNDIDDDCDGQIDEGFPDVGQLCEVGVGTCRNVGVVGCAADGRGTLCSASELNPGANERCGNRLDDDCDGQVDEGFEAFGEVCGVGQGACGASGVQICTPDGLGLVCSAQEGDEGAERCDNIDNNCDGQIDEAFPLLGQTCTVGLGICARQGQQVCAIDGTRSVCNVIAGQPAEAELCGNSQDDDCDGNVDEGFGMRGQSCTSGLGICARSGMLVCSPNGTRLLCNAQPGPDLAEVCDGLDNDCDGDIDEDEICGAPCVVDMLEPNDLPAQATPAASGDVFQGTICFFDVDFFSLGALPGNTPVTVNLLFSGLEGELDVEIYADGEPVAAGSEDGSNEQVFLVTPRAAAYTVAVFNRDRDGATDYRLGVLVGGECAEDLYERNDDAATAPLLAPGALIDAALCGANGEDWFDLGVVPEGAQVTLTADFVHAVGNLDVFLWEEGELTPTGEARTVTDDETLTYYHDAPSARFFAEVRLVGAAERVPYTLRYARVDDFCVDDDFDSVGQGDTLGTAIPLNFDTVYPEPLFDMIDFVRSCSGDLDIYNLGLIQAGQERQVNLVYDDDQAVLILEILNSSGQVVAADDGNSGALRVPFTPTAGGTFYARVTSLAGSADYRISHTVARYLTCPNDAFETDYFLNYGSRVRPGVIESRRACLRPDGSDADSLPDADYDVVKLGDLEAGQLVFAWARFRHAEGDIGLFIQRDGLFVAQADANAAEDELLLWFVDQPGDYDLVIILLSDGAGQTDGNAYRLQVDIF